MAGEMPAGFAELLAQKYAILQQEADARTRDAATTALTGAASAGLDVTRSNLLPATTAADIAKSKAETNLVGQQARFLGPEALARIGQIHAETGLTGTNNSILRRSGLIEHSIDPEAISDVLRRRTSGYGYGYEGLRLGDSSTYSPQGQSRPAY